MIIDSLRFPTSKDRLELGDDFIPNEIVHSAEVVIGGKNASGMPYTQSYMNRDFGLLVWSGATLGKAAPREFCAILYSHSWTSNSVARTSKGPVEVHATDDSQHHGRSSVFVGIPHVVQNTEGVSLNSTSISSVVRLEVLNQVLSGRREVVNSFKGRLLKQILIARGVFSDRERDSLVNWRIKFPQTPNNVVQNGPQIMDTFSRNNAQTLRNLFIDPEMKRNTILSTLRVELGFYSKRTTFKEVPSLSIELTDVFDCSIKPESGDFYTVHIGSTI